MASALPRPATRTTSRCTTHKARGTHAFEINDYSFHRALGRGNLISSAAFIVGNYSWCIDFYPDGSPTEDAEGHVSVFLKLLTKKAEVRALYDLRVVDQTTGSSCPVLSKIKMFITKMDNGAKKTHDNWGKRSFMKIRDLESSPYLKGDRIVIECDVTVMGTRVLLGEEDNKVQVPPSNLSHNFGKLLETGEASDVTFSVEGEVFHAHKIVLSVRSPVFKEKLCSPVGKDNIEFITIGRHAACYFQSTASLHLYGFHAFDGHKYALDRLKLICEDILCKHVDVGSLATLLVLADQHDCRNLKDACHKYSVCPCVATGK
ncbi:hypothetical protein EJB05_08366, partial [Eragrostis curvula]